MFGERIKTSEKHFSCHIVHCVVQVVRRVLTLFTSNSNITTYTIPSWKDIALKGYLYLFFFEAEKLDLFHKFFAVIILLRGLMLSCSECSSTQTFFIVLSYFIRAAILGEVLTKKFFPLPQIPYQQTNSETMFVVNTTCDSNMAIICLMKEVIPIRGREESAKKNAFFFFSWNQWKGLASECNSGAVHMSG